MKAWFLTSNPNEVDFISLHTSSESLYLRLSTGNESQESPDREIHDIPIDNKHYLIIELLGFEMAEDGIFCPYVAVAKHDTLTDNLIYVQDGWLDTIRTPLVDISRKTYTLKKYALYDSYIEHLTLDDEDL